MDLPVLYCDDRLAVVNKPAGLMVHDSALARGDSDFAAEAMAPLNREGGSVGPERGSSTASFS